MGCTDKNKPSTKTNEELVIKLQHGNLSPSEFLTYFENKVLKTIKKYNLIDRNEKICVAASGGKDSTAVLYLTKKYFEQYNLP